MAPIGFCEGAEQLPAHGLAEHDDKRRAALILRRDRPPGGDLPVRHRRVIGAHTLDAGGPVLVRKTDLPGLADQIAHLAGGGRLPPDRPDVGDGQGRSAAGAAAGAAAGGGARQNDHEVGPEPCDLLSHRLVGALADGHHDDQCGDADKDPEHRQCRTHLVAPDCLRRRRHHHPHEGP